MSKNAFDRIGDRTSNAEKRFVAKALDISEQVMSVLKTHPTINSQRKLARALGKSEAEVSKWLSGLHNLTLESITKIEAALETDIIMTCEKAEDKYGHKKITSSDLTNALETERNIVKIKLLKATLKRSNKRYLNVMEESDDNQFQESWFIYDRVSINTKEEQSKEFLEYSGY